MTPRARQESASAIGGMWRAGRLLPEPGAIADIDRALAADQQTRAWMFLPRTDAQALHPVVQRLELDDLAVEDVLNPREGIKVEWLADTMLAVIPMASYDPAEPDLDLRTIALVANPQQLVVMADPALRPRLAKALHAAPLPELGMAAAIHAVLDACVDSCSAALHELTESVEKLSERIFQDQPFTRDEQLQVYRLRRSLGRLRRGATPMSDVCTGLANAADRTDDDPAPSTAVLGTRSGREFSDVADHARRVAQLAEALREEVASMYETNLSLADVHLNTVMKKLAAWGAIIAVPTLITGYLGMNVQYPGFGTSTGFVVALVVLIVAPVLLYVVFRRADWL